MHLMATIKVKNFDEAGKQIINIVARKNTKFFLSLWDDVIDSTPVLTGTAQNSWIFTTVRPSRILPPRKIYPGKPERPALWLYTYRWMNWYMTNNQPYVVGLNNGSNPTKKASPGWIDAAIKRATDKYNAGGF